MAFKKGSKGDIYFTSTTISRAVGALPMGYGRLLGPARSLGLAICKDIFDRNRVSPPEILRSYWRCLDARTRGHSGYTLYQIHNGINSAERIWMRDRGLNDHYQSLIDLDHLNYVLMRGLVSATPYGIVTATLNVAWEYYKMRYQREYKQREERDKAEARYLGFMRCILGNPFVNRSINEWYDSPLVKEMVKPMWENNDFDDMPILADYLEEQGCQERDMLAHCRSKQHVRGCWVLRKLVQGVRL